MRSKLKETAGFTLVELIVVIAILGILAGVGGVAYAGYIEKANKAADNMLLSAINTAFSAACLDNGDDVYNVDSAELTWEGKKVIGVSSVTSGGSAKPVDAYNDSFVEFYGSNANSEFKVITGLLFDAEKHVFVDVASEDGVTISYGGGTIWLSAEDLEKLNASTFITADGLGVDGLLDKVNEVAEFAALFTGSDAMEEVFRSDDFQKYAAKALGFELTDEEYQAIKNITAENLDETMARYPKLAEYQTELNKMVENIMTTQGCDANEANKRLSANIAVMYAAKNAASMNTADIINMLSNPGAKNTITGNLASGNTGTALSQAAVAYGMYTAYAYSTGDQAKIEATQNPVNILNGLDDSDFQTYMNSEQGKKDLEGYLAAMNMVNSGSSDPSASSQILVSGFNDQALKDLLNQALGQN